MKKVTQSLVPVLVPEVVAALKREWGAGGPAKAAAAGGESLADVVAKSEFGDQRKPPSDPEDPESEDEDEDAEPRVVSTKVNSAAFDSSITKSRTPKLVKPPKGMSKAGLSRV